MGGQPLLGMLQAGKGRGQGTARTWPRSLVLEEGVLLEEATEAGLFGASPFFSPRALSMPFSGGEWAGLTRGVAGSCRTGESAHTPVSSPGPPPQHAELPKCCSAHLVGDVDDQVVALVTIAVLEHSRSQHPKTPQKPPQSQTPLAAPGRAHPPRVRHVLPKPSFLLPKALPEQAVPAPAGASRAVPLTYRLMLSFSSAFRFLESML